MSATNRGSEWVYPEAVVDKLIDLYFGYVGSDTFGLDEVENAKFWMETDMQVAEIRAQVIELER